MSLLLSVSEVYKAYDGNKVLKGTSFSFDRAGIYILRGPNGSGKSTFLRLCALLENPDQGEVTYFSEDVRLEKDLGLRRRITLVLPGGGIFNTTVMKNLAYGLRIRGVDRETVEEKADGYLKLFGLSGKRSQNALTLSSGETRRLALARAMILDPEVLLLDEPTAYVDHGSREMIEQAILNIRQKSKCLVIMATHDVTQAERLAEKVVVLKDGKIVDAQA